MSLPAKRLTVFFCSFVLFFLAVLAFRSDAIAQSPGSMASLTFSPETIAVTAGSQFTTQVWIDTDQASVGGVGAKITYDPTILSADKIETLPIFPDYPAKTADNSTGNVVISGIVRSKDELYSGKAQFATITWTAKTSGDATIAFNFKPNETKDSNIAVLYGNGDILQKTNTVAVHVSPITIQSNQTQVGSQLNTSQPASTSELPSVWRLSPFEIAIGLMTLVSLCFQLFLFLKVREIQKYKEAIPHIHTPNQ